MDENKLTNGIKTKQQQYNTTIKGKINNTKNKNTQIFSKATTKCIKPRKKN